MKTKLIVHHSASPAATTTLDDINLWHREAGFNLSSLGYYIGYHYVIDPSGKITMTRDVNEIGCHCNAFDAALNTSYNKSSIGICVMGNFEDEQPTAEQVGALTSLITSFQPILVLGHRDVKDTLCPGKFLYTKVVELRRGSRG